MKVVLLHALPLDEASMRVLRRLGLLEGDPEDLEALRASIEHVVPKARGALFNEVISALADEFCWEESPRCASCPLSHECLTAQELSRVAVASDRGGRPKSR